MKRKVIGLLLAIALIITSMPMFSVTPANAATSQAYTWKKAVTGTSGGYMPGFVYSTKQKNLVYARTDMGGAYRSTDGGATWTQLLDWVGFDDWNLTGVESIALDPTDANRLYMAVGTYTNSWASTNGAIFRSTDQGATFQRTDLPFKLGGNMPGRGMGERLMVDPNKPSILYFGARSGNGLWKSTDYGATWAKVTSFPNAGTYIQDPTDTNGYLNDKTGVVWVTFDPKTGTAGSATQTIYVGVADKTTSIYRSTDGGATWAAVPGQPTGYLPHHGILGSNGIMYVTYSDTQGPYDGAKGDVYKYDTATGTWTMISPIPSTSSDDYFGYGALAVDPQKPTTLMVVSLNSWWPDALIFRSTDAGATWTRAWDWTSYPSRSLRYTIDISTAPWLNFGNTAPIDPVPAVKLGWMIDGMVIDPFNSNNMLYGTGATVYGCNDLTNWDAGTKITLKSMGTGMEESAVQDLISPPTGTNLYSALGDIGGFQHTDLTKAPTTMYSIPYAGTYNSIDFAELNPSFMVRAGKGDPSASPPTKSTAFTYNAGGSWFAGNTDIGGITGGGTIAAAADASAVVWAPVGGQVSYSTDNGNSWIVSQGNIPTGAMVRSDRANASKFYAYSGGNFYVSTDKGKSFTKTAATGLPTTAAYFKAVPGIEGDIWLAGGSATDTNGYGLWHSTNSGASFTKLANVQAADTVGFGKAATGQTYMAIYVNAKIDNIRGFFRSDDGGASWIRINDDKHQYGVANSCITGDPRIYGRVYIGTNGLGIVYGDIAGTVATPTPTPSGATVSPTVTPTPTPSTATATPTPTPSTATATPTPTPSTATATPTPTPSTATATPTPSTATATPTPSTATPTPTPTAGTPVPGGIKVQFFNGNTAATSNTIYPNFKVVNTGTAAINLSDVKVRYYFTNDGTQADSYACDYSSIGSGNVTSSFTTIAKTNADRYLEVGFTTAAGTLAAGANAEVKGRIWKSDWSNFTQTNDYSFNATATNYVDSTTVTGWLAGALKWGTEP